MDDDKGPILDPAIRSYYDRRPEETRLERGLSQLEAARTRQLIARHAPPPPATVLDVGGAAGAYAAWLAAAGYVVHLVDPVPRLIEEARRRNATLARPMASCEVGDARALRASAGSVDVVLLLGPLYHLTEHAERRTALLEAARVLRPGGVLFAAAISRWASLFDGIVGDLFTEPGFMAQVEDEVQHGQHRNPAARAGFFTTAYFHRPEELRAEVTAAGFEMGGLYGLEGPARMLADFEARWSDPRQHDDLLHAVELIESEPSLLGLSAHLLAVARKR